MSKGYKNAAFYKLFLEVWFHYLRLILGFIDSKSYSYVGNALPTNIPTRKKNI